MPFLGLIPFANAARLLEAVGCQEWQSNSRLPGAALDRTALLATVSSRLAEVVILLTAAGEERLAAYAEALAQQVEVSALEDNASPQIFAALRPGNI